MKSALPTFLVVVGSAFFAASATAVDMPGLIVEQGCNNCHKMDRKLVGPTWMEISRKYKGNDAAPAKLSRKIIAGGSGAWGPVPMPGYPTLSDPEISEVVASILKLSE
jgi:cytochrome c